SSPPPTTIMPAASSSAAATPATSRGGGRVSAFTMRAVARMSRARWFIFLRRVYQYQNGPRSDLGSNPFNSSGWLALELGVIVAQMVITTTVVATSPKERPAWPLRLWVCAYNVGNVLSLPLLYWRHRHSSAAGRGDDPEMHGAGDALRFKLDTLMLNSSYLMNKARAFLELFFAMWFVMGNVWVFDARLGSFHRAPRLYALCIGLLAWNAVVYSLPFLLFLLLCCFVPVVGYALGYNMNSASVGRGASDEQLDALPRWRFKEPDVPRDREKDDEECCICLAQYREKEEVRQLPCTHMFHLKCVDRWLRIISSCPLCKQELS
uniref:RING-type domain-containing protein n=1 Tax=Aegilops tauschii subsp. strangulata TaxID=200361 RepID=A0A453F9Z0_AEGTS